jgi:hypothetical protein
MGDASRIFESMLVALPEETILALLVEGSINEDTYNKLMGDASQIFESMLVALPEETILALVKTRFKTDHSVVLKQLKNIADSRERPINE